MKTLVNNHWRAMSFVAVMTLIGGTWLWQRTEARQISVVPLLAVGQNETYTPIDMVQRDRVRNLLDHIHLDRDVLTALNLTNVQAENILSGARTWCENNLSTLTTLQDNIHIKVAAVRIHEKKFRTGPFDAGNDTALTLTRQELSDARSAYETSITSMKTAMQLELSPSQQATWEAIKTGWGQQMPIRMLDLTDEQRMAVSKATRTYKRQRMASRGGEQRATAVTTYNSSMDQILTVDQKSVIDSFHSYYTNSSIAVASAFDTVLAIADRE